MAKPCIAARIGVEDLVPNRMPRALGSFPLIQVRCKSSISNKCSYVVEVFWSGEDWMVGDHL